MQPGSQMLPQRWLNIYLSLFRSVVRSQTANDPLRLHEPPSISRQINWMQVVLVQYVGSQQPFQTHLQFCSLLNIDHPMNFDAQLIHIQIVCLGVASYTNFPQPLVFYI